MVSNLNIYKLVFVALFILKIGEVDKYADFSWAIILAPLVIGTLHSYISWIREISGERGIIKTKLLEFYLEALKKRVTRRALKDLQNPKK